MPGVRAFLVANARAASVTPRTLSVIEHALASEMDLTVDLQRTKRQGHATHLAKGAVHQEMDLVISLGGDGTVNEIANGLAGSSVPLAIIPGGGTNVLARSPGIPPGPIDATAHLLSNYRNPPRRGPAGRGGGPSAAPDLGPVGSEPGASPGRPLPGDLPEHPAVHLPRQPRDARVSTRRSREGARPVRDRSVRGSDGPARRRPDSDHRPSPPEPARAELARPGADRAPGRPAAARPDGRRVLGRSRAPRPRGRSGRPGAPLLSDSVTDRDRKGRVVRGHGVHPPAEHPLQRGLVVHGPGPHPDALGVGLTDEGLTRVYQRHRVGKHERVPLLPRVVERGPWVYRGDREESGDDVRGQLSGRLDRDPVE